MVEVGARLRTARDAMHLSLEQVAGHLGMSKQAVHAWEKGQNPIDINKLFRLARLYETTVIALIAENMTNDDVIALTRRQLDRQPDFGPTTLAGELAHLPIHRDGNQAQTPSKNVTPKARSKK